MVKFFKIWMSGLLCSWKLPKLVPAIKMLYINLFCWWLMFFFCASSWGKSTLLCAIGWNCSSPRNRSFYNRENLCPDEEDWSVSCQAKQRNRRVCSESATVCSDQWSLETCGCMYIFFFHYLVRCDKWDCVFKHPLNFYHLCSAVPYEHKCIFKYKLRPVRVDISYKKQRLTKTRWYAMVKTIVYPAFFFQNAVIFRAVKRIILKAQESKYQFFFL